MEQPPTVRSPKPRSRRWAVAAAVVAALVLSGCQLPTFGAYRGATSQGRSAFQLWQGFFIAGAVVFLVVFFLIIWAVLRYRRKSEAIPTQTQYHAALEIAYTVVPIVVVLVLFVFTFITENNVDALSKSDPVTVNVTAFQWGWSFQYSSYDGKVQGYEKQNPEMVVPAGQPVRIFLRSTDVIHGFYVPEFNFSRYALPGVTNQFDLTITHPGTFRGQCTQFCGLYHSLMLFQVKAVTSSQFTTWVHQQQQSTPTHQSITTARRQAHQHPVTGGSTR